MNYTPNTPNERDFMNAIKRIISEGGVSDFWRPVCDPYIDDNGNIGYFPGKRTGVGMSCNWWERKAKEFCPERGSRLGTRKEYLAFYAVLIKELVASGKSIEWAWNAVCNDSRELGHYRFSSNAKNDFEPTGSREVCGWCDLGNAKKILADDVVAGGWYGYAYSYPLATLRCASGYIC